MPTLRNGRLPADVLLSIPWDPTEHVRSYALPSLVALNTAFRARFGHNLIINEGYRDYATQERYYDDPPSGVGTAAWPGTSNHGWGLALDLRLTAAEYAWMLANAPRFGWVNPLWARDGKGVEEPWHWEHIGAPAVVPDTLGDDDMTPEQDNLLRHAVAMLGEIPARTATAVAGVPVSRVPGKPSTWLQDTVDGTTAALEAKALVGALTATVKALATGQGVDPATITAAAEKGARAALAGLTLRAQ